MTDRFLVAFVVGCAALGLSILAGIPEATLLGAPWLVLLVLGLTRLNSPEVRVQAAVDDDRVIVGDTVEMRASLWSSIDVTAKVSFVPEPGFWADDVPEADRVIVPEVGLVGPQRSFDSFRVVPATGWGAHDLGRVHVAVTPSFGLVRLEGFTRTPVRLRVHPTPQQLRSLIMPRFVRRTAGTHTSSASARGTEYADIRGFGSGDSVRDINWRASARANELLVSQRHPDRATDVVLFVDSFVDSGHDVRGVFGVAVEAAFALAESHLGATDRVGLIQFGGILGWVTPGTGRMQLQRLSDALLATGLFQSAADKELPLLSHQTLPPRSFVVALSPLLDQRFVEALDAARARGHDVAVIDCGHGVAPSDSEDQLSDPTAALASQLWRLEHAMLRDRLIERGIAVAQWRQGDHIEATIRELVRRRRAVRVRGR